MNELLENSSSSSSSTTTNETDSSQKYLESPKRKGRLQRSERLHSDNCPTPYTSWEALVRESFGQIAWPIKIASWELVNDYVQVVPTSSSATELISRRGLFSRRPYSSADQLPQSELEEYDPNYRRFRLENGESQAEKDEVFGSPTAPILENPENQTRWYFKYFLGKLHQNYAGIDSEKAPYFLSVVFENSGNICASLYRAILFRKQGTNKISIPLDLNQKLTIKQILNHFSGIETTIKPPKEIFSPELQKGLLMLEEQEGSVNFKFGVIYMKNGQTCDNEMLSNENPSDSFLEFLNILGDKIRLKGWTRFRGGLDIKGDMTGKYAIYTQYEGHEIIFHVSTLLPFSRDDQQQVERKRHIGNDIINIIFIDSDEEKSCDFRDFNPSCIKSQFTHIFAVVSKCSSSSYRLSIFCDDMVPPFGPTLPNPPEFSDITLFREFLLVKLINGEKATFETPIFSKKRERTLEMLIQDLYDDFIHEGKLNMLNRRAFSEVLYDIPKNTKQKDNTRLIEFFRIGQALKLEAIIRGDAPTSLASTSNYTVFRRQPWEPQCFFALLPYNNCLCGDSIDFDRLIIATENGTFLIKEDQNYYPIFDKTINIRQLNILEMYGLLLILAGAPGNRDGYRIHVFRLREFQNNIKVRNRTDIKNRRIDRTKGCQFYSIANVFGGYLRMAVAIGKKILLYQWKYTAAYSSWLPENDIETIDGFLLLKDIQLHEYPMMITILEGQTNTNTGGLICIGNRHYFEIICDQTGSSTKLYEIENSRRNQTQIIAAIELCDGQETELLLCYNHTCHFKKLDSNLNTNEYDFHWNTTPKAIVCAFPYIIAFTLDSMEIRLLVNGNLVYTVNIPDLQFITSKKDIFFATTISEILNIQEKNFSCDNISNSITNDDNLINKNKIEIENENKLSLNINKNNELHNLLSIPVEYEYLSQIQRVNSLEKHKIINNEDIKCSISTSNSYGIQNQTILKTQGLYNPLNISSILNTNNETNKIITKYNQQDNFDNLLKIKPLSIYRIPLVNLTGTNSHYHTHNATTTTTTTAEIAATSTMMANNLNVNTKNNIIEITTKTDSSENYNEQFSIINCEQNDNSSTNLCPSTP